MIGTTTGASQLDLPPLEVDEPEEEEKKNEGSGSDEEDLTDEEKIAEL